MDILESGQTDTNIHTHKVRGKTRTKQHAFTKLTCKKKKEERRRFWNKEKKKKGEKYHDACCPHAVTHPSTEQAQQCLTFVSNFFLKCSDGN